MTPRINALLVLVAILVVYNVWQWWPEEEVNEGARVGRTIPDAIDLRLAGQEIVSFDSRKIHRDLFNPVAPAATRSAFKIPGKRKVARVSASDLARQHAQAVLAEFQLVGTLFRGRERKAFLMRNEESLTVAKGDKIAGKFVIDNITVTSVTIRDVKSSVTKTVKIQ